MLRVKLALLFLGYLINSSKRFNKVNIKANIENNTGSILNHS